MKYIKIFLFLGFLFPTAIFAASDFQIAAQLLSAAKNADIAQVQTLVNNGANINYIDNTGLSIVCTAIMNNDMRGSQILQMYGADASKCDSQIKKYKQKTPKTESGGLFSGLSSAQGMALAAAGAAVVIGGVVLLGGALGSSNDNGGTIPSNTCRTNASCTCTNGNAGVCKSDGTCDCSGTTGGGSSTAAFTLPYGPAMPNAASETANYAANLNYYSPATSGILADNFTLMTNTYGQNYLLMMRGYAPAARGYLGMRTLRNNAYEPISIAGNNIGFEPVLGGRPVNVALITANGINARSDSSLGERILPWTTTNANNTTANGASNEMISSKYYNNKIVPGTNNSSILDDITTEDLSTLSMFDLSNSGSAINNALATSSDNLLGKIVGGKDSGYTLADYMGFMPNGQMTIFRTGGGMSMRVADNSIVGDYTNTLSDGIFATGDVINLGTLGSALEIELNSDGHGFIASNGTDSYSGYRGADGLLYLDTNGDGSVDRAYSIDSNSDLKFAKELFQSDFYNYKALLNAGLLWAAGDVAGGRSRPDIIANASVIEPLHGRTTKTMADVYSISSATARATEFARLVNLYYDVDIADGTAGSNALPGTDAANFFGQLGSGFSPLVIFSTGASITNSSYLDLVQEATFENSAPLVFNNLEHLFMSVVAVGLTGTGTNGTTSVSGYAPSGKIALAQWKTEDGIAGDTAGDKYYRARACGVAGSGAGAIDPWCFSAAGLTDEMAVSSMAGAAGALKSAFSYLNNKQLFALLALTADGPYLATNTNGTAITSADLKAQLMAMYQLPPEYQFRIDSGGEDYFKVFKEVFGYGLINLERATKPGSKIYYYDGTKIVSASGNGYWRKASNTTFSMSAAFNSNVAKISAPFYDILESPDGTLSMPRIFQNEFSMGTNNARGLYMGDVLGEFSLNNTAPQKIEIGKNTSFEMSVSDKQYLDNFGGLDNMRFGYNSENLELYADYQNHFLDGANRFSGNINPILGLASNAMSLGTKYKFGDFGFGGRAFSGNITSDGLLENDPTISSEYAPASLGQISGAAGDVSYTRGKFEITSTFGNMIESDTVLGAYTGGLLNIGGGNTTYIDNLIAYNFAENMRISARATFAKTVANNADGAMIMGISDMTSNAFALSGDFGNFEFSIAAPLAIRNGNMQYAHAEYDAVENSDGNFDLVINNTYIRNVDLSPDNREMRISGAYRTNFGADTDAAFGFIYRVNPNNTYEFGNESILMMKLSHKIGI